MSLRPTSYKIQAGVGAAATITERPTVAVGRLYVRMAGLVRVGANMNKYFARFKFDGEDYFRVCIVEADNRQEADTKACRTMWKNTDLGSQIRSTSIIRHP